MKLKGIIAFILCIVIAASCIPAAAVNPSDCILYSIFDLKVGETMRLTSKDANNNLITGWTSTAPKVASITTDGLVTALSKGDAVMELNVGSGKIGRMIHVAEPDYKLSKTKLTLYTGDKSALKLKGATGKVTWKTSNKNVAAVSSKGVVTAKKKGTATITAKILTLSYKCRLTVKNKPVKLSVTKLALAPKNKYTLKLGGASGKVKWSSSKKSVAAVSAKGVVTAKKNGKANITAKYKGKAYKCALTVSKKAKTVLGKKAVTEDKNTVTISKVKTSLDPAMLKSGAKLTLKKANGLPKLSGTKMTAYDFSLKGAKVTSKNLAVLEIPQKVAKGKTVIAGYYNEKKKKWEPVPCSYKNGKVSIIASHFSTYGVGAVSDSCFTYNDKTTTEKLLSYWAPHSPSITGKEALSIVSQAVKSSSVPQKCVEWGWEILNKQFDNNVNWKTNLFGALGISTKLTDFINDNTASFGAIGFGLAYIEAIRYAYSGDNQNAAYTAFNGFSGAVTALVAQKLGTAAISAGCFAVTVITYALTKTYEQALSDNEKKWYKYYKYYYQHENPRRAYQWKDLLLPILNKKGKPEGIQKKVEAEVDKYVQEAWNSEWFAAYFHDATGLSFGVGGGLSKSIQDKLSAQYKNELMKGDIALVYKWKQRELQREAEDAYEKTTAKLAKELNQEFTIKFYDGQLKKGKTSKLAGYTVRWKNIPKKLNDKKSLKLKLNSKGKASTKYTLFAAIKYNIKPKLKLVNKKGKVVKTFTYKINSKTAKVNLNPKAKKKAYKWVLSSNEKGTLLTKGINDPVEKLGSSYKKYPYGYNSIVYAYDFSFGDNSITTKYTYTYNDTDDSSQNKTWNCSCGAYFSTPKSTLTPGAAENLTAESKLISRSTDYGSLHSSNAVIELSFVNPKNELNPKYPWFSSGNYVLSCGIDAENNKVGDTESRSADFPIPKARVGGAALQTGDVFYLTMLSSCNGIVSYITHKYTYKSV